MPHAMRLASSSLGALIFFMPGCHEPQAGPMASALDLRASKSSARLFEGMGKHHRLVANASPQAQKYFDQGLIWAYAFNHDEGVRSFTEATRLDPDCAMAWWGIALCNGPHINNPIMTPQSSKAAWAAIQRALALKITANPTERALLDALSKRYADPPPADRRPLDEAYAAAMSEVWQGAPTDMDVGVLYAEAMMDLQPWDLWTKDDQPKGRALEIMVLLELILKNAPDHPGANHLYIHAVEDALPARATAAADRLRDMVPASGHLVHMPSHIDVRIGQWAQASKQNERAIKADQEYRKLVPRQGFYHIYMAHNQHMLAFASMMEGRSEAAIRAARDVVASVPEDYGRQQAALIDAFMAIPYETLNRFGRWDEVLKQPAPPEYWPITIALWRFARGIAFAAKGEIENAQREQAAFREAAARIPADALVAINKAKDVLAIADQMLAGELAYRQGRIDEAVSHLRAAIKAEDDLMYTEPPEWIQPVRHTLGAVLLEAGRYEEAEQVYREDLARWPENGWSLYGLAACLQTRASAQAAEVQTRFQRAWSRADVKIGSSCLCVVGGRKVTGG